MGIGSADYNDDGWMDIYISNDFLSNDILYINQQDGTFRNEIAEFIREQSYNGMGNDIGDFNNDGRTDIYYQGYISWSGLTEWETTTDNYDIDSNHTIDFNGDGIEDKFDIGYLNDNLENIYRSLLNSSASYG